MRTLFTGQRERERERERERKREKERERERKRERERERESRKCVRAPSIPHSFSQSVSMRDYYINNNKSVCLLNNI